MKISFLDYITGVESFWNLSAPAIAILLFFLGLLCWGLSKERGGRAFGLSVLWLGLAFFLVACTVDGARNVHDVNALSSAARERYGVSLDASEAVGLMDAAPHGAIIDGKHANAYGTVDLEVGGTVKVVTLYQINGLYQLGASDKELPTLTS